MKTLSTFPFLSLMTALCLLCLQSCDQTPGTASLSTSATYPLTGGSEAALELKSDVEYLVPASNSGAAATDSINRTIISCVFGEEYADTDLPDVMSTWAADAVGEYKSLNLPMLEENPDASVAALSWVEHLQGEVNCIHKGILSYTVTKYAYLGGAHGMTSITALNFDLDNGSLITEMGFFKDGYEERLSTLLSSHLPEALRDPEDIDMLTTEDIQPNGNFRITEAGITYIYNQYEIGPYVLGAVEVTIPWSELKDLLR